MAEVMLSAKLRNWSDEASGDEGLSYWCQGCNGWHSIRTKGETAWGWNGDVQRPTFTPSVLLQGTRLTDKGNAEIEAWRAAGMPPRGDTPFDSSPFCCHSFVTDGKVQFLGDCTHALAGQTHEMADLPSWGGE